MASRSTSAGKTGKTSKSQENPWLNLGKAGKNLRVEDFPSFHLWRLSGATKLRLTKQYLKPFDLSVPEWRLISLLAPYSPLQFSELTERSNMDKGQVSRTLQTLDSRGLAKMTSAPRKKGEPQRGIAPRVSVSITAKGKSLYQRVLPVARKHQAAVLDVLTPAERTQFYSILQKVHSAVDAIGAEEE